MRASTLSLPNEPQAVAVATDFVHTMARLEGLPEREALRLTLAAGEAVTNVIRHAYALDEEAQFQVECRPVPLGLRVRVSDRGLPYDPKQAGGRGMDLMDKMVDLCMFHNLGVEGKAVELIVYRPSQPAAGLGELSQFATGVPPGAALEAGEEVEIRLMRPDEALEVSRCIYRAYGYSYVYEHAYYPERLVELNRTGQLTSAVAVSSRRGVLGHAALMREPGEPIGEMGMAVVHPDTRGLGLCRKLFAYLLEETVHQDLLAVYAHAVTAHSASQRVLHSLGFRESGLLLGYAPATLSFRGLADHLTQRESIVLMNRVLVERGLLQLYTPPQHRRFLEKAFENLGLTVTLSEPPDTRPETGHTMGLRVAGDLPHGQACFEILRASAETVEMVRFRWRELRHRQVESMQIWLSLHDPAAVALVGEFEQMGFFLAGIQPGWRGQDALILQYLNNIDVDLAKLVLEGDVSRRIAEIIGALVPADA